MFEMFDRIRKFDPKKLTVVQWGMIIVGVIVFFAALSFIINLANMLLPWVIIAGIVYFAYRTLTTRDETAKQIQEEKREETISRASSTTQRAAQQVDTVVATKIGAVEESTARLSVEQEVNPESGFKEANMSRLLEEEEAKIKSAKQADAEEVQRQLEERRRRLLGNSDSSSS
jgi:hypothetical protein